MVSNPHTLFFCYCSSKKLFIKARLAKLIIITLGKLQAIYISDILYVVLIYHISHIIYHILLTLYYILYTTCYNCTLILCEMCARCGVCTLNVENQQ